MDKLSLKLSVSRLKTLNHYHSAFDSCTAKTAVVYRRQGPYLSPITQAHIMVSEPIVNATKILQGHIKVVQR